MGKTFREWLSDRKHKFKSDKKKGICDSFSIYAHNIDRKRQNKQVVSKTKCWDFYQVSNLCSDAKT